MKFASLAISILSKIPLVNKLLLLLGRLVQKVDGSTTEILSVLWIVTEALGASGLIPKDVVESLRPALGGGVTVAWAKRLIKLLPYLELIVGKAKEITEKESKISG